MRVVFFGTPAHALPSLEALAASSWEIASVVTNPDRPAGRGYKIVAPPVKSRATELGLEVRQPDSARDPQLQEWLEHQAPDAAVVVAYGKILPPDLLAVPRLGFVNLHFSLLPAYRGAAPVQHALLDGLTTTGVSIMLLTEGMDEGPVLARRTTDVAPEESAGELGERLAELGAGLIVPTLDGYAAGNLVPEPQDDAQATYAPKLSAQDGRINWSEPARRIHDRVRALNPAPGAWTAWRGKRIKVWRTSIVEGVGARLEPGAGAHEGGQWLVGTGDGVIAIEEAQIAGRKKMTGDDLARGLRSGPTDRFEEG